MLSNNERLHVMQSLYLYRQKMIEQIKSHNDKELNGLLEKSFRYEKSPNLFKIALEQYVCSWMNLQLEDGFQISKETGELLLEKFTILLQEKLEFYNFNPSEVGNLVVNLLKEKIVILQDFINFDTINNTRINKLKYQVSRDDALFNRIFNSIEEE